MSDSENTNTSEDSTADNAAAGAGNALAKVMELKDSSPKVFFGAIGAVVVLLLIVMMSGGSDKKLPKAASKNLSVGQQYTLKSANRTEEGSTVSMVAVPGTIAAFDDSEEEDGSEASCRQQAAGTAVKVLELQDFHGKKDAFAHVEVLDGECSGRKGWVLAIDMQ